MYSSSNTMGTLRLEGQKEGESGWSVIFSQPKTSNSAWQSVTVSPQELFNVYARYRFTVTTGTNYRSDVAIDDVVICYAYRKLPVTIATMTFRLAKKRDEISDKKVDELVMRKQRNEDET